VTIGLVTIGDIAADLRSGFSSGEEDPDGVVQFRMNNVGRTGEINWDKLRRVPSSKMRDGLAVQAGDILFNATNSPELVGKTALFSGFHEPVTFSNHFIRLRTKSSAAEPAYVARWLQREFEHGRFAGMCRSWVNQASITKDQLTSLSLPLPPLDEQRRIAAILDKADTLRRQRKRAIDLLDSLTQSIFLDMFGDLVSPSKGWGETLALGDLADIVSGITKGRKLNGEVTREIPYLAVSNVQDKFLDLSIVKTIQASGNEIQRYRLKKNDLLLTEGGDPDKLGRGTLWADELSESIHQNHIFRARVNSPTATPTYLIWLLGSPYGKAYFLRSAKQTTGIASINKRQLSNFPVVLPPIGLQAEFERRAHSVRRILQTNSLNRIATDLLFSSLQSRAFSGQL
jgi:type I restriction enzyme, S subunit